MPSRVLALGTTGRAQRPPTGEGSRPPWRSLTVIRALLLFGPHSQAELALLAGVSQPRVSQIFTELEAEGLLARRPTRVPDWDHLLDHWLARYPGPGGVRTHWHGLAPLVEQSRTVCDLLSHHHDTGPGDVLVSGEVAADHLAPWGRPARSVVYSRRGEDLRTVKLSPCLADDATLTLIVPQDPGVWALAPRWWAAPEHTAPPAGLPLADPLQILTDLYRSPTIDADQTAQRLRRRLKQDVQAAHPWPGGPETDDREAAGRAQ